MTLLDRTELNPKRPAEYAVIWLHGLGADGHDFEPIVPALNLPEDLPVRFVFPHAPMRPVTINGGMVMRAWYDILDLTSRKVNLPDILEASGFLQDLIQHEIEAGIDAGRIVLAGFSQGGAIALHTGLRYDVPLAGIMALSTYSPTYAALPQERTLANANVSILMAHGRFDPMIPISAALETRDALMRLGYPVQWQEYPMQHEVCLEEIQSIREWLIEIFS
jgi:phospholipase/carboxylesterase